MKPLVTTALVNRPKPGARGSALDAGLNPGVGFLDGSAAAVAAGENGCLVFLETAGLVATVVGEDLAVPGALRLPVT
jgi:hypothetical protein